MRALVGQPLTRTLDLRTGAIPVTGATATYVLTPPSGTALSPLIPLELTPGLYVVNLTAAQLATSGLYQESWVITSGADVYTVAGWFVLTSWMPGLVARWELRHDVADQLRDLTLGTVESAIAVSFTDSARAEPDNHWLGAEAYFYGGTSRGQSRTVVGSTQGSGTQTVSQVMSPVPVAGDLYELHRRFTSDQINRVLNRALSEMRHTVLLPIETATLTTTDDNHYYTVPAPFDTVRKVEWQRDPQTSDPTRWYALEGGDWDLHSGRQLYLRRPHDATVRILGEMAWDDLPDDDALTGGPVEWLRIRAAAMLLSSRLTSQAADAPGYRDQLTYLEDQARRIEPRSRPRPNSRRVRA